MKSQRNALMSAEKKSLYGAKVTDIALTTPPDWMQAFDGMQVKVSDHEKQVIEMLKEAATTIGEEKDEKDDAERLEKVDTVDCAPEWYHEIRRLLPTLPSSSSSSSKEKNEKKEKKNDDMISLKKADAIRAENTGKRVLAHLATLHEWVKTRPLSPPTCSNPSFPIELRVMVVMVCIQHRLDRLGDVSESDHLELIVAGMKLLRTLEEMRVWNKTRQCVEKVDTAVVSDLSWIIDKYRRAVRFNVCRIAEVCPRLMIRTQWDRYLPGMGLSPYPSQQEVLQLTHTCLSSNASSFQKKKSSKSEMIWLSTLTGEGKTSLVIGIAKMVMDHNRRHPSQPIHVLYTCDTALTTIRQQVGQSALAGAIPFGVTEWNAKEESFTDHDHPATAPAPRVLTIATVETAVKLLQQGRDKTYLLFYDEPTFGLDVADSDLTVLTEILSSLPFLSVWASATAPRVTDMPGLTRLGEMTIHEVRSTRVQIGAELFDETGELFVPHLKSEELSLSSSSSFSLTHRVQRIRDSGFLQKSYTSGVVHRLWEVVDHHLEEIPSFHDYFIHPAHLCQSSIQSLGLAYLQLCAEEEDDEVTAAVCDKDVYPRTDEMVWSDLLTTFHRYRHQTLVVVDDPCDAFQRWVRPYLEQTGVQFADSLRQYQKDLSTFQKLVDEVHDEVKKKPKMSQLDRERWLNERLADLEEKRPHIHLPAKWILGSRAYYSTFSGSNDEKDEKNEKKEIRERDYVPPEYIDWDRIACQDFYQMALAIGVGIIAPGKVGMSASYTQTVRDMAARGQLAYVIAGESIGYGTNYPFETILIESQLAHRSVNSLFQLFARAGRPGKSWRARIHLPREMKHRLQRIVEVDEEAMETQRLNEAIERAVERMQHLHTIGTTNDVQISSTVEKKKEEEKKKDLILDSWEDEE